ncbi:hypothetical protein M758_UG170900 [Ceratodon purpureus]|nr:hypothetical protein M758_UG170900 [Ceratodon purpureus]
MLLRENEKYKAFHAFKMRDRNYQLRFDYETVEALTDSAITWLMDPRNQRLQPKTLKFTQPMPPSLFDNHSSVHHALLRRATASSKIRETQIHNSRPKPPQSSSHIPPRPLTHSAQPPSPKQDAFHKS